MSPAAARKRSRRSKRRRRRGGHSLSPSLFALAPLCTAAKRAEGRKDARRGPRFVNIETTDNLESALGKREREKKSPFLIFPPTLLRLLEKEEPFRCLRKKPPLPLRPRGRSLRLPARTKSSYAKSLTCWRRWKKYAVSRKKREERRDAKFGDGAHRVPPSNDDGGDFLPLPLFSCSHPASLPLNNQPTDQPGLRSRRPRRHRRLGSPRPPARPRQAPPARPEARDVPDGGPAPRARGPGVEVQLWLEPREGVSVRREGGRQKGVLLCESLAA